MARAAKRIRKLEHYLCPIKQVGKNGVLDRVFEALQRGRIINMKIEVSSLDSTIVKVHPDGTGALKKRSTIYREIQGWMDNKNSYGCRGC